MEIRAKRPSRKGGPDRFIGEVWIDEIAGGEEGSRLRVSAVRFAMEGSVPGMGHLPALIDRSGGSDRALAAPLAFCVSVTGVRMASFHQCLLPSAVPGSVTGASM